MATATVYSSVPTAPYDIHPNGFLNQNYEVPNDGTFGMGSAESFYPPPLNEAQTPTFPYSLPFQHPDNLSYFKPPQVGLVPTFPTNRVTYSGGLQPTSQPYNAVPHHLQSQSLSTTVLSPSGDPSTSLQGALTLSAASLRKKIQKTNKKSKGRGKSATGNVTQSAKRELLSGNPRRKRRPNKRPPGTSFSDLLVRSFRSLSDNKKRLLTFTELLARHRRTGSRMKSERPWRRSIWDVVTQLTPRTSQSSRSTGSRTATALTYQRNTKRRFQTLSALPSWPSTTNAEQSMLSSLARSP